MEIEEPHELSTLTGRRRADMPELTVKRILTNLINIAQESTPGMLLPSTPAYSGHGVPRVQGLCELRGDAAVHRTF